MEDRLARDIESIRKECAQLSLALVSGSFTQGNMPVITWKVTGASEWRSYLELAKNQGISLVVLEQDEFDEEVLNSCNPAQEEDASEEESSDAGEGSPTLGFETEWNGVKRKYEQYYGSLYAYALHWVKDGVCCTYEARASWYEKLIEQADELGLKLEAAKSELGEQEIPALTEKKIEEIAAALARNGLFQEAANQGARRYAFKKQFPKILEGHADQVSAIIDHAKGLFELEIKPELERALEKQIDDLARDGLSKEQIARRLRVPVSRVRKIL